MQCHRVSSDQRDDWLPPQAGLFQLATTRLQALVRPLQFTHSSSVTYQTMPSSVISGQCACGKVRWSSTAAPDDLNFCYCSTCQQASGAPFAPWMGITKSALSWTGITSSWGPKIGDGNTSVSIRTFCSDCGSCVAMEYDFSHNRTDVAAGTTTEGANSIPKVCMHFFLKTAPRWYQVPEYDGVARYEEFPPELQEAWVKYESERSS